MRRVNINRLVELADRQSRRLERTALVRLREVIREATLGIERELRRLLAIAIEDTVGQSRVFKEARARVLLAQLRPYLEALDWADPRSGVPPIFSDLIRSGYQAGSDEALTMLRAFEKQTVDLAAMTARINVRAVEAAITNTTARLSNYSSQAIAGIEQAVVNGIIRGDGVGVVARDIRRVLRGDKAAREAGLYGRARMIARTEMSTARQIAREEQYEAVGITKAQWYATLDERTCEFCSARHGLVFNIKDISLPAHPNCRCSAVPFRDEFLEAGLIDIEMFEEQRAEIAENFDGDMPRMRLTPFEKANGMSMPQPVWRP